MSRGSKITVAVILAGALGFPAYAGYDVWTTSSQLTASQREVDAAKSASMGWAATESAAQDQLNEVETRSRELAEASTARLEFDSSLEAAKEQLQLAAGRGSIEPFQARIVAAQDKLIAAGSNSLLIEKQTAELDAVTVELKELVGPVDGATKADAALTRALGDAVNAVSEALNS